MWRIFFFFDKIFYCRLLFFSCFHSTQVVACYIFGTTNSCCVSLAIHSFILTLSLSLSLRSGTMLAEPQEKDTARRSSSRRVKAACFLPMERSCTGPRCSSSWPSCPLLAETFWSSWLCHLSANSKMPLITSSCL